MQRWDTVTIVGVGLLGGSIGLALRERGLARKVVGVGRRAASLRKARSVGAVDSTTTSLERGVAKAELVIICTPVSSIAQQALEIAQLAPAGVLLTDVGSIKAEICEALSGPLPNEAVFIGSHPLAGSEKSGPEHAQSQLLEGRVVVMTPTAESPPAAVERIATLWTNLGAQVHHMSPAEHDATVAITSHLPHVVAAALAAATPAEAMPLASTGWRDTTRVAGGDVELWRQILTGNRLHTLKAVEKFGKVLKSFTAALKSGDDAELTRLLEAGKKTRDTLGS